MQIIMQIDINLLASHRAEAVAFGLGQVRPGPKHELIFSITSNDSIIQEKDVNLK